MSTHDETQTTNTTNEMNDNLQQQWFQLDEETRPRRFCGLTQREGFADYVEQAYWMAQRLGIVEELAALPSLSGKSITEISELTADIGARICAHMSYFNDDCGPNIYYGALTRMVAAAKEDVGAAAGDSTPLPGLPTSPLVRQSGGGGAAAETVSDSEIELGRAAVRDVLASRIASAGAGWTDISGHPFVGRPGVTGSGAAAFIRTVPGFADQTVEEEPPLPLVADGDDRDSDEDSASIEDEEAAVDTVEVTGVVDDGEEADTEGGDEEDGAQIQHIPAAAPPAVLHQNIGIELPLWAWLAILAAFTAWAALVNGVLSRDLGCRPFGGR